MSSSALTRGATLPWRVPAARVCAVVNRAFCSEDGKAASQNPLLVSKLQRFKKLIGHDEDPSQYNNKVTDTFLGRLKAQAANTRMAGHQDEPASAEGHYQTVKATDTFLGRLKAYGAPHPRARMTLPVPPHGQIQRNSAVEPFDQHYPDPRQRPTLLAQVPHAQGPHAQGPHGQIVHGQGPHGQIAHGQGPHGRIAHGEGHAEAPGSYQWGNGSGVEGFHQDPPRPTQGSLPPHLLQEWMKKRETDSMVMHGHGNSHGNADPFWNVGHTMQYPMYQQNVQQHHTENQENSNGVQPHTEFHQNQTHATFIDQFICQERGPSYEENSGQTSSSFAMESKAQAAGVHTDMQPHRAMLNQEDNKEESQILQPVLESRKVFHLANNKARIYTRLDGDGIFTVRLANLEGNNVLLPKTVQRLSRILDVAAVDSKIKVVVLLNRGDTFSSSPKNPEEHDVEIAQGLVQRLLRFPKPIIASVVGHCEGLLFFLLQFIDIVVAHSKATFAAKGVYFDPFETSTPMFVLPPQLGPFIPTEMMINNRVLTAKEAYEGFLVSHVFEGKTKLGEHVRTVSAQLAKLPQQAARSTKNLCQKNYFMHLLHYSSSEYARFISK